MQEKAQQQEMEQDKQLYEKPVMSAVRLFADQVLQTCPNNTIGVGCTTNDPTFS